MHKLVSVLVVLTLLPDSVTAQEGTQQFANLGECVLESTKVVRDCKIGYRTFGRLNNERTNAVLVPTWFTGTTADLAALVGPGRLFDASTHFVVAVDALGNGVSISPSNSDKQPRMSFPLISIRDMVNSQYRLLTEVLGVKRISAVAGISMGGMQVFEWLVAYPDVMDSGIAIVGSPRLAAYDLLSWQARINAIRDDPAWNDGNYREQPARRARAAFSQLLGTTPTRFNATTRRDDVRTILDRAAGGPAVDANDYIRQAEAMMALDVSQPFAGDLAKAAASVKAKLLVVVSAFDHVVTPGPAVEFAAVRGSVVITLQSDCGHLAFNCESDSLGQTIREFLSR